ncbi:MAG: hypothetical protein WCA00_02990 [Candidatus Acidiferrales bacterium]
MFMRRTKMIAALFAVLAYLIPTASLPPQGLDRTVYIERQTRMYPVTVERVTVGDSVIQPGVVGGPKVMQPGTPFQANSGWLKNMSFVLKNRTNKTIDWALIYFVFPDVQSGLNCSLEIGRMPANDFFTGKGGTPLPHTAKDLQGSPLSLAAGQTFVFKLADHLDEIQSCVEAFMPFAQVTRIAIEPHDFFFQDGMRWDTMNRFGTPDPNQPGKFTNLAKGRYFPGDPGRNWPPAAAPSQE